MNQLYVCARAYCSIFAGALFVMAGAQVADAAALSVNGTSVGSITAIGPQTVSTAVSGGVNFWAAWDFDSGQSLVDPGDVRWLQLASFSQDVDGFPDRPFIDPLALDGFAGSDFDALPWYDITGPTQASVTLNGGGDDAWMGDGPYAAWSLGPVTFSVDTLVVRITDAIAKQARVMGGIHWGYSITGVDSKLVSAIGVTDLSDSAALRDAFNTALAIDFPGWTLVVPEPQTLVLALSAGMWVAIWTFRRWRWRAR